MKLTSAQLMELVTPERKQLLDGVTGSVVARLSFEKAELVVVECSNSKFLIAPTLISETQVRARPGQGASALLAHSSTGPDSSFEWIWLQHSAYTHERALGVDQSNESIVLDEKAIIKWQLFAEPSFGATKELCLSRNKFSATPAVIGQLWWRDSAGTRRLLATINKFVANSTDGWTWFPKMLNSASPRINDVQEIAVLASTMHNILAELGTETFSGTQVSELRETYASQIQRVKAGNFWASHPEVGERIQKALESLSQLVGLTAQPIHGDFHVGQLIKDEVGKLFVIDFDGDPLQSQNQQNTMRPVVFDIASMVCSIIHAGMVAIKYGAEATQIKVEIESQLEAFLQAYENASGSVEFDRSLIWNLVWLLEVRELDYATQFLDRWTYAPLGAIEYLKDHHGR